MEWIDAYGFEWEISPFSLDAHKVKVMRQFLATAHLSSVGGYEYDTGIIDDRVLVVAELDPAKEYGATKLSFYKLTYLREWHDRAAQYMEDDADADFEEAVYETKQ